MVGIKSDAGNVRELNEDYASFIEDERFKIYLVADGMGGHNAGEIASKLAVKSIIRYLLEHSEEDENLLFLLTCEINRAPPTGEKARILYNNIFHIFCQGF